MVFLLVFGAIALLAIGYAAGSLTTIVFGGRVISDHSEGRFARREKREPADEPDAAGPGAGA